VVAVVSASGGGASPTITVAFLATPVSVAIAGNTQKIHVTSTKALGSVAVGGAQDLDLWICSQLGANPIVQYGAAIFDLRVAQNTRDLFTMSFTITGLAAGTYNVGLCGNSPSNAANWNNNEFSYTSAIVAN